MPLKTQERGGEARIGAAFGSMAMQHVDVRFAGELRHGAASAAVDPTGPAAHRNARYAELQAIGHLGKPGLAQRVRIR